jgi:hypothetical protein
MCPWFDPWRHHFKTRIEIFGFFVLKIYSTPYLHFIPIPTPIRFYGGATYDLKGRAEKLKNYNYANSDIKIASTWDLTLKFEYDDRNNAFCVKPFIKKQNLVP